MDLSRLKTCSQQCDNNRKATSEEIADYITSHDSYPTELWFCGYCRNGQNEWTIPEMLFDTENEFLVTPCCHTEAAEALQNYRGVDVYGGQQCLSIPINAQLAGFLWKHFARSKKKNRVTNALAGQ